MTDTPLLRLGILHFLGSFFRLDDSLLSEDPTSFALTSDMVEKGAMSFHSAIAPSDDSKNRQTSGGWEIICTGLGISLDDIRHRPGAAPQKYVTQVWSKAMSAQGMAMFLDIKKDANGKRKGWKYGVENTQIAIIKKAYQRAKKRYEGSLLCTQRSPSIVSSKGTSVLSSLSKVEMGELLGDVLRSAIGSSKKILFLTADSHSARSMIPFLFKHGVSYDILGTSTLISNDKRLVTSSKNLHNVQFLLLSVNFFSMRYEPSDYDLVILHDFPSILNSLHVSDPLPSFVQMARQDNHENPPSYYRDLWKAADVFHFVRHVIQEAGELWVTNTTKSLHLKFLERLRGALTFPRIDRDMP